MAKFTILATGSTGLVASGLKSLSKQRNISFYGLDLHGEDISIDITDKNNLLNYLNKLSKQVENPVLFHFAAIPITGDNLTDEQINLMRKVNVDGTANILSACARYQIPMVHISTDFVFSAGRKRNPYLPTDKIIPDKTVYAQTKADAERLVLKSTNYQHINIIRIAFPYGNMQHSKQGLLRKMLSWMDNNPEVGLYNDQYICPTSINYIAKSCLRVAELIVNKDILSGIILHIVGKPTTPYDFGVLIRKTFDKNVMLKPTSIKSKGPLNLVLDTQDTEQYLGFESPTHKDNIKSLA